MTCFDVFVNFCNRGILKEISEKCQIWKSQESSWRDIDYTNLPNSTAFVTKTTEFVLFARNLSDDKQNVDLDEKFAER